MTGASYCPTQDRTDRLSNFGASRRAPSPSSRLVLWSLLQARRCASAGPLGGADAGADAGGGRCWCCCVVAGSWPWGGGPAYEDGVWPGSGSAVRAAVDTASPRWAEETAAITPTRPPRADVLPKRCETDFSCSILYILLKAFLTTSRTQWEALYRLRRLSSSQNRPLRNPGPYLRRALR
jgi:hypothetical protein